MNAIYLCDQFSWLECLSLYLFVSLSVCAPLFICSSVSASLPRPYHYRPFLCLPLPPFTLRADPPLARYFPSLHIPFPLSLQLPHFLPLSLWEDHRKRPAVLLIYASPSLFLPSFPFSLCPLSRIPPSRINLVFLFSFLISSSICLF